MSWKEDAVPSWFGLTVRALVETILRRHGKESEEVVGRVADFVRAQHGRMPDYLRLPLAGLTLLFDAAPLLGFSKPFHRRSPEQRRRQVRAWRESRLGFRRDLMRFYESLATLGCAWEEHGSAGC
jgi:hypothetical protein